jgi:hypothetical protein
LVAATSDRVDLQIDFLPVVHIPNDAATARVFGRSLLLLIAHALDDLISADTDLALDGELLASPPVRTTGLGAAELDAGPGSQWNLPAGATAELVDTSRALTARLSVVDQLLRRVSANSAIAQVLLGEVTPDQVPSGVALELGFAPTRSLIRTMRLVRAEKYSLLLKFAARLAQAGGLLPAGELPHAELALGSFLPADVPATVDRVTALLRERAISTRTGVQMLIEVGLPIADAGEEVRRIREEGFEDAVRIVEATGDVDDARRLLGLPMPGLPGGSPAGDGG